MGLAVASAHAGLWLPANSIASRNQGVFSFGFVASSWCPRQIRLLELLCNTKTGLDLRSDIVIPSQAVFMTRS